MAPELSKKQRAEIRVLQGLAWENELAEALRALHGDFDAWQRGEISVFDLSDQIHEFHNGKARQLYNFYTQSLNEAAVARAIVEGKIAETELSKGLLSVLRSDIEYFRERFGS